MSADDAAIVAGLTKEQQDAILYGRCAKPDGPEDCICDNDVPLPGNLICVRSRLQGGDGAVCLTPLGLSIRAALQQNDEG